MKLYEIISNLKLEGKTLVLATNVDSNLFLAASNLPTAEIKEVSQVSVYEILKFKNVVLTSDAVKYYEEVLG